MRKCFMHAIFDQNNFFDDTEGIELTVYASVET